VLLWRTPGSVAPRASVEIVKAPMDSRVSASIGRNHVIRGCRRTPMIRTVWLALFCLVGIAAIASVKFVSSALGTRVENPSAQVEIASIGLNAKNEELVKADIKADRLAVNVELASYEATSVIPIKIDPVDASVHRAVSERIVSRHWHEPKASARSANSAMRVREKNRNNKRKMVSVRPKEPECSLQSLNLSSQCGVTSRLAAKRGITTK
jgi:hypothetical protein